jgi:hypothetical protein
VPFSGVIPGRSRWAYSLLPLFPFILSSAPFPSPAWGKSRSRCPIICLACAPRSHSTDLGTETSYCYHDKKQRIEHGKLGTVTVLSSVELDRARVGRIFGSATIRLHHDRHPSIIIVRSKTCVPECKAWQVDSLASAPRAYCAAFEISSLPASPGVPRIPDLDLNARSELHDDIDVASTYITNVNAVQIDFRGRPCSPSGLVA